MGWSKREEIDGQIELTGWKEDRKKSRRRRIKMKMAMQKWVRHVDVDVEKQVGSELSCEIKSEVLEVLWATHLFFII
jgi:phosphate-selective porin